MPNKSLSSWAICQVSLWHLGNPMSAAKLLRRANGIVSVKLPHRNAVSWCCLTVGWLLAVLNPSPDGWVFLAKQTPSQRSIGKNNAPTSGWLVVWTPLKIWKSIGMISNPIFVGKFKKWQPNHQPAGYVTMFCHVLLSCFPVVFCWSICSIPCLE